MPRHQGGYKAFPWKGDVWGSHFQLKNLVNGESLWVGQGVINYIRKYGFYEGLGQSYRVDPIRLVSILTGNGYCSIAQAIGQACDYKIPLISDLVSSVSLH